MKGDIQCEKPGCEIWLSIERCIKGERYCSRHTKREP